MSNQAYVDGYETGCREWKARAESLSAELAKAREYAVKLRIEHKAEADKLRQLWDADAAELAKAREQRDGAMAALSGTTSKLPASVHRTLAAYYSRCAEKIDGKPYLAAELSKTQQQFAETVDRWADDMIVVKDELSRAREALRQIESIGYLGGASVVDIARAALAKPETEGK
jgi:hypothetical protein